MKAEYDLSKLTSRKNPYASKLKKPVTMRLSEDVGFDVSDSFLYSARPGTPGATLADHVPLAVEAAGWRQLLDVEGMTVVTAARIGGSSESTVSRWLAKAKDPSCT